MRWLVVIPVLAGCGGPNLGYDGWQLVVPLLGPGIVEQGPDCDLAFRLGSAGIIWLEDCGRRDLPTGIEQIGHPFGVGFAYQVTGGNGTNGVWFSRDGEHHGLAELWVMEGDLDGSWDYDAKQVVPIFRVDPDE